MQNAKTIITMAGNPLSAGSGRAPRTDRGPDPSRRRGRTPTDRRHDPAGEAPRAARAGRGGRPRRGRAAGPRCLLGRPLLLWTDGELDQLRAATPHEEWPSRQDTPARYAAVRDPSARWRGQLDPQTWALLVPLPPGTPARLALHLHRVAGAAS
jgi:hypothetical protein